MIEKYNCKIIYGFWILRKCIIQKCDLFIYRFIVNKNELSDKYVFIHNVLPRVDDGFMVSLFIYANCSANYAGHEIQ